MGTDEQFAGFIGIETYCRHCMQLFLLKTKLHKHLLSDCPKKSDIKNDSKKINKSYHAGEALETSNLEPRIIKSTASGNELGSGFAFRNWTYTMIAAKLDLSKDAEDIYADIGCGVSLIDRAWHAK